MYSNVLHTFICIYLYEKCKLKALGIYIFNFSNLSFECIVIYTLMIKIAKQ